MTSKSAARRLLKGFKCGTVTGLYLAFLQAEKKGKMDSVKPGNIIGRSQDLDSYVKNWELEYFFVDLIDVCRDGSDEIKSKSNGRRGNEFTNEALICCGQFRQLQKLDRNGDIDFEELQRRETIIVRRAMELRDSLVKQYAECVP